MMNRVELIGRLTRDLELRRSANGGSNLRFTLAVDRRFKQPGGPEADFISCVAFNKTAENMARYLHKGSLISVEGRIQTGSYVNQQGQKIYTTDVVAENVQFLESRKSQQGQNYTADGGFGGSPYGNQSYGGNSSYGGGSYGNSNSYGNSDSYGGGFQESYSSGGYGANPYAQSVDSGFAMPSGQPQPAQPASKPEPASDSSSTDPMFDESTPLDISSDDLPF